MRPGRARVPDSETLVPWLRLGTPQEALPPSIEAEPRQMRPGRAGVPDGQSRGAKWAGNSSQGMHLKVRKWEP